MPQARAMDKAGPRAYLPAMLRLLTIIVSAFMLAVVSFTASAHETGMAVSREFGSAMQHMEHAEVQKTSCADDGTCATESGLCDLVCMGTGVFLPPVRMGEGVTAQRENYLRNRDIILVATPPAPDDRPPIAHLL